MPTIRVDFYSISVSPDIALGWLGSSTKLSYLPTVFYQRKNHNLCVSFQTNNILSLFVQMEKVDKKMDIPNMEDVIY